MELSTIIILLLIIVLFTQHRLLKRTVENNKINTEGLREELATVLATVNDEISALREKLEYENLTDLEKEQLIFEDAPNLPLSFFEELKKGQVVSLMSGSYYYPSTDLLVYRFQYKHDYIDKENKTKHGYEVHGFDKSSEPDIVNDEWSERTLLAENDQCHTSSCAGTVKKAI